jgi:SAM-dependent methyltransferase
MSDYLLGSTNAERERLARQHALWGPELLQTLRQHGVGPGASVLEVGCGPGLLLSDLVELVGPSGKAAGLEIGERSAAWAREQGLDVTTGDLRTDDLGGPWDAIVARWVLSFFDEIDGAVARMADALRPGGRLIVQDYDHDGLRLHPPEPVVARIIAGIRAAYAAQGGDLWVGLKLPGALASAGLEVLEVSPWVRAGHPSSDVARWFHDFVVLHAPSFVEHGGLDPADADAFQAVWERARSRSDSFFVSPMQITAVGRRPA